MKKSNSLLCAVLCTVLFFSACKNTDNSTKTTASNEEKAATKGTYAYDVNFLKKNTKGVIELQDETGAKVLLSAQYQGRVMTSSAFGDTGNSFGWLNYALIGSGEKKKQFNPVGGEERFWLGPEGGQYSLYFKKGDAFDLAHWQVPTAIDTEGYDVAQSDNTHAVFTKNFVLTNYSGAVFNIDVKRTVALLNKKTLEEKLNTIIPASIHSVAYHSDNQIKNMSTTDWKKENGLLSIWLLGMFTPSASTSVIIPFHPQADARKLITDNYFGSIPPERLVVKDSVLYFSADGKLRSKIGISPKIAKPMTASFDFEKNVLTVCLFDIDKNGDYVNSKWELQKEPFKGDAVNSYNDGVLADGTQMGPFYELESSSSAFPLKKGETQIYQQTTCHFQGDYASLRTLAQQILGVDLDKVKK